MLKRTHLAIGFAVAFYFMPHINTNAFIFLGIVLIASIFPDIESGFSAPKRHKLFAIQPLKWITHKNLIFHTYTLLIILSIVLALIYPPSAFPFFLGYSFHLFVDSFSPQGIRPFWPIKGRSTGKIVPGGRIDMILFYIFSVVAFALLIKLFI
ncbi:MAG: metal-dependent hydrolase [Nanoarchaeota archaeon]|nr:metal-dependent hydrolase [Nanoarchaeota archaeon]